MLPLFAFKAQWSAYCVKILRINLLFLSWRGGLSNCWLVFYIGFTSTKSCCLRWNRLYPLTSVLFFLLLPYLRNRFPTSFVIIACCLVFNCCRIIVAIVAYPRCGNARRNPSIVKCCIISRLVSSLEGTDRWLL